MKIKASLLLILSSFFFIAGCASSTVDTTDLSAVGNQDIQSQNQAKLNQALSY